MRQRAVGREVDVEGLLLQDRAQPLAQVALTKADVGGVTVVLLPLRDHRLAEVKPKVELDTLLGQQIPMLVVEVEAALIDSREKLVALTRAAAEIENPQTATRRLACFHSLLDKRTKRETRQIVFPVGPHVVVFREKASHVLAVEPVRHRLLVGPLTHACCRGRHLVVLLSRYAKVAVACHRPTVRCIASPGNISSNIRRYRNASLLVGESAGNSSSARAKSAAVTACSP